MDRSPKPLRGRRRDTLTPLGRVLDRRGLSYEVAAAKIRAHYQQTGRDDDLSLGGAYLGMIVREEHVPSRKLAMAIAAWVDDPEDVTAAELMKLDVK